LYTAEQEAIIATTNKIKGKCFMMILYVIYNVKTILLKRVCMVNGWD
jgi:hypothetical protein|tara:strand:- start:153 stop:293 length:141 start_codon:yes stop_codon:yes gene_type:complete